jgi:hypothetical protein
MAGPIPAAKAALEVQGFSFSPKPRFVELVSAEELNRNIIASQALDTHAIRFTDKDSGNITLCPRSFTDFLKPLVRLS